MSRSTLLHVLVEQGHGSGASTLKSHSQFGTRSLQVRSSIHQCRALFSSLPTERLTDQLDVAIATKVRAIKWTWHSPIHAFLLFLQRDPYHERTDGMDPVEWTRACVAVHRDKFAQLPWAQKMEFQAEADITDMQRRRLWQDDLGKLQDRKSSSLHQLEEELDEASSTPSLVSSHRLGPDDLHRVRISWLRLALR